MPDIRSVSLEDGIHIVGATNYDIDLSGINLLKIQFTNAATIEEGLQNLIQRKHEVWILQKDFTPDSRFRDKPPTLHNNCERYHEVGNDKYIIFTKMWVAIHIITYDPFKCTIKCQNKELGPITGEWW